jgi:acyl carrier protein
MNPHGKNRQPFTLSEEMISTRGDTKLIDIEGAFETDAEILLAVKAIINSISCIHPREIAADAFLVDTLNLDPLSVLEVRVDMEYAFGLPQGMVESVTSVPEAVTLIRDHRTRP